MSPFNDSCKVSRLWRRLQAANAKSWSLNILGLVQVRKTKSLKLVNPVINNAVISHQCSGDRVRISHSHWGTTVFMFLKDTVPQLLITLRTLSQLSYLENHSYAVWICDTGSLFFFLIRKPSFFLVLNPFWRFLVEFYLNDGGIGSAPFFPVGRFSVWQVKQTLAESQLSDFENRFLSQVVWPVFLCVWQPHAVNISHG